MENLLLGILAGLAICTKQSIGVTLAFIVVMYPILLCENKGQIKQYFKFIVLRFIYEEEKLKMLKYMIGKRL